MWWFWDSSWLCFSLCLLGLGQNSKTTKRWTLINYYYIFVRNFLATRSKMWKIIRWGPLQMHRAARKFQNAGKILFSWLFELKFWPNLYRNLRLCKWKCGNHVAHIWLYIPIYGVSCCACICYNYGSILYAYACICLTFRWMYACERAQERERTVKLTHYFALGRVALQLMLLYAHYYYRSKIQSYFRRWNRFSSYSVIMNSLLHTENCIPQNIESSVICWYFTYLFYFLFANITGYYSMLILVGLLVTALIHLEYFLKNWWMTLNDNMDWDMNIEPSHKKSESNEQVEKNYFCTYFSIFV